MDAFITTYVVVGIGFLCLSVILARRIRSAWLRAAIHAAVFAIWFSPGFAVGEGGAMPAPLLLLFFGSTFKLISELHAAPAGAPHNPWPMHYYLSGLFWGLIVIAVVWIVSFLIVRGVAGILRHWQKKQPAA